MRKLVVGKAFILWCLLMVTSWQMMAQVPLRSEFGAAGRNRIALDDYNQSMDMVVQPDGKAILLSASGHIDVFFDQDVTLSRYTGDGQLDPTFGTNGVLKVDFKGMDHSQGIRLRQLPDGSLLVMGSTYRWSNTLYQPIGLLKVTPDGQVDTNFGDEGTKILDFYRVQEFPTTLRTDPSGRIYVGGASLDTLHGLLDAISIGRLSANGDVDSTFGQTGRVVLVPDSGIYSFRHEQGGIMDDLLVLPNGQLLVMGATADEDVLNSFFQLLNEDGTIDSLTWGVKRIRLNLSDDFNDRGLSMEMMPNGEIAFGARIFSSEGRDFILGRFDPSNGSFKTTTLDFGGQHDLLNDLTLTANGGLVAVGETIEPQNVSSIYKSDNFAIAYYPDFSNWDEIIQEQVRFQEGYQGGGQAVAVVEDRDLIVSGFTYTDTPGNIDIAQFSWRLTDLVDPTPTVDVPLILLEADYINGGMNLIYGGTETGTFELSVYDMTGRQVFHSGSVTPGELRFNRDEMAPGAYLAVLYQGDAKRAEQKFILF